MSKPAAPPSGPLRAELTAGVLTLTLDRPDKRNALDAVLIDALSAALERADLDAEVRVVALRGAGKDF
ncbi:MAG TPA: enoyl-CoA hydratase-related protein, partial [Gemmatimonadales bacterium]|nr:enoyl-CoA hydratase-related protein [Gemmatimonadales bacterium]